MLSKAPETNHPLNSLEADSSTTSPTQDQNINTAPKATTNSALLANNEPKNETNVQDSLGNDTLLSRAHISSELKKTRANLQIKSFQPKLKSSTQNQDESELKNLESKEAQSINSALIGQPQTKTTGLTSASTTKSTASPTSISSSKSNSGSNPQGAKKSNQHQDNTATTFTPTQKITESVTSQINEQAAVYDGLASSKQENQHNQRKNVFLRSLQFRIIWIVILAGFISMTVMSILSYHKITQITHDFVDEEISQIASVAINYRMIIPRRWEAPRHYHDRILNLVKRSDGSIEVQLSTEERQRRIKELAQEATNWFSSQDQMANPEMGRGQGGPGHGLGQFANEKGKQNSNPPSLSDLSGLNYDIMIAPLFGRPGDALYIPLGVSDGFYTVIVADERVRAFIATNANGQRFVVARPLSSLTTLIKQSFYASFHQFFWIDLIAIPLIIILSINFMLRSLNRIAQDLYHRSEEDLSPVVANDGSRFKTFIPSELDGFIISINRLFQRVDESMQSKRRFIADAAHEMRTQSTVLSLQIAALDNEEMSPSARKKVQRLKEGIAREKSLMTSLLTLAREQGCSDLSLESISIFDLYTKLIEEQGLLADNKNIDLGVEGEVNYSVISDRSRLTRIMSNLLSNAIKYTPSDGRIDLKAELLSDGSLVLTVQDDGPGIPPEHLKHILEPFYRVDGDRSAVQGTGLGLAIVKASCDSLKAKLQFANATPHGLIASVTLRDLQPQEASGTSKS